MEPRRAVWAVARLAFVAIGVPTVLGVALAVSMGDGSWREWLLSLGGAFELCGLVGVAAPEISLALETVAPPLSRAWRWASADVRRLEDAIRSRFGRPRPGKVYEGTGTLSAHTHIEADGVVTVGRNLPLPERVDRLTEVVEEVQDQQNTIRREIRGLPGRWKADVDANAAELRQEHATELRRLRDEHKLARLIGVLLLAIGIVLATLGNLV